MYIDWRKRIEILNMSEEIHDEVIKILENLYIEYKRSGVADDDFTNMISSTEPYQYEQALSEMLFFHFLKKQGFQVHSREEFPQEFDFTPDFIASKNDTKYIFELVTIEPASDSKLQKILDNPEYNLSPNHEDNELSRQDVLLRITRAINSKYEKITQKYKKNYDKIGCKYLYVIVVNDRLLCQKTSVLGLCNEGDSGVIISYATEEKLPASVVTLYCKDYQQLDFINGTSKLNQQIGKIQKKGDFVSKRSKPFDLGYFTNTDKKEISAVLQITLLETFAYEIYISQKVSRERLNVMQYEGLIYKNHHLCLNNFALEKIDNDEFQFMTNVVNWKYDTKLSFKEYPKSSLTLNEALICKKHWEKMLGISE